MLEISKIKQCWDLFWVSCKGLGVVCVDPNGIESNVRIGDFLGDVVPLWYWYERQKAVKEYISNNCEFENLKLNSNKDFYNITVNKAA